MKYENIIPILLALIPPAFLLAVWAYWGFWDLCSFYSKVIGQ